MVQDLLYYDVQVMEHPSWKSRSRRMRNNSLYLIVKGEKVQVVAIDYAGNEKNGGN